MTDQLSQVREAEGRYRTLLELTAAIDKETNVQVVLKSLHKLLSAVIHFDSTAIMLLTRDTRSLRLVAFERGLAGPNVDLGGESLWAGTAAGRAVEEQRTIYVPDIRREMSHFPDTASQAGNSELRSAIHGPNFHAKTKARCPVFRKARRG